MCTILPSERNIEIEWAFAPAEVKPNEINIIAQIGSPHGSRNDK